MKQFSRRELTRDKYIIVNVLRTTHSYTTYVFY
jgi:hypothetical protein